MRHRSHIFAIFLATLLSLVTWAQDNDQPSLSESLEDAFTFEANGDHDAALIAYSQLLDETTARQGNYSMDLAEILTGLGRNYIAVGSLELADQALQRSQHIVHRNEGVYSPKQFEVIEIKTRLALDTNQALKADKQQRFLFFLASHHYEGMDSIPSYVNLSKWYIETGQFTRARKLLKKAINLIKDSAGEYHLAQLQLLQLLSQTRRMQGLCCGEKPMKQSLDILSKNDNIPRDLRADTYREYADVFTLRGKKDEAANYYALARQLQSNDKYQAPKLISMTEKLNAARRSEKKIYELTQGSYVAGFSRLRPLSFEQKLMAGHQPLSVEQQLLADHQPPQIYVIPGKKNNYNLRIRDSLQARSSAERTVKMTGEPFQFVQKQLQTILPGSLQSPEKLAAVSISVEFTVSETGKIHNIEFIESNAPVKLDRLIREVLGKVHFRPALVDGYPTIAHNIAMTQSFPIYNSGR